MSKLITTKIKKCRLCNSNKLISIHSFGNLFVSNFVSKNNIKNGIKAPLNLVYCKNCKLLQLKHSAPQEIMYKRFYWYRSSVTQTMRKALKDICTFERGPTSGVHPAPCIAKRILASHGARSVSQT